MTDHVKPLDTVLHQTEVLEVVKNGEDAIDILQIILVEQKDFKSVERDEYFLIKLGQFVVSE